MDLALAGKKAIVTGGSSGIGFACASALRKEGVDLVIAALPLGLEEAGAALRSLPSSRTGSEVITVGCDLAQASDIDRVVQTTLAQFRGVDILVNCAGAARAGAFLHLPDEAFLEAWTLKLLGYIRMVRAVVPSMMEKRDGRIVNIVGASSRTPTPTLLPVSTTNAALISFTRGISKELAPHNVRINSISPGPTATPRAEQLALQTAESQGLSLAEVKARQTSSIPLGRKIDPNEIATMVVVLVSDLCASITGCEILIDGGSTPGI